MNEPDAYFFVDKLRADCEKHSEAYGDWLEEATIRIMERWEKELRDLGEIADLGGWEHDDIIAFAVTHSGGVPYQKALFDLAWKHADESGLYEKLSWS